MPTVPEMASAFRNRFRLQEPSDSDHVRSSPALSKSRSKENLLEFSAAEKEIDDQVVSGVPSFELQEDPSFWKDHNVQVVIRIRPLSSSEISLQGHNKCVKQDSCQSINWTGHPESRFTFDHVADENVSQEKLFKVAGLPMVDNCMGGYNSCMFAYGQTGSGKTHTMLGDIEGGTRRHSVNCGMTPRVFEHLFSRIQKEKESRRDEKLRFTCKCSFLEIYNEQILDLLNPSSVNLQIREDVKKGVYVENLTELEVSSCRDVIQQLVQGAANRKVAATNMNRASSRSHSVFTCIIESKWESQGVTHHRFARLNLVDLAGSERQKSSGAEGERLKEATNINKSLSTLGLVIMNLVSICNGKSLHVPYRDSKLTFLLQDSLGGNSKTIIIANISPSNCCALETLSTLKFAQRAKFIRNNAIVNEDASGDVLTMRLQIQQLKKEVNRLRGLVNGGTENQENDNWNVCFPGSPGSFKWDGVQGLQASLSPLTSEKRISHKKEYEVALVGAFRREQDKEIALKALAAENQATMQLAKQREEEIQGLKMRLRFREAGVKRLEAVASGKISAEAHLLQEKDELLKEIEVLRNQVDRNQEVTRFAMENLRLKEEIRRLQSFYEDGEREMVNEQIIILQNKLLEALDWKLMHEKDPKIVQEGNVDLGTPVRSENNLLTSGQDPSSPWDYSSSINEENEFLRMQAIQNQKEVEALRKNLNFCLEAKEKLERRVDDLVSQLEEQRKSVGTMKEAAPLPSKEDEPSDDCASIKQIELQTLVDAISAASQREAEAHETAIMLSKENEELRMKLKVLIEDNNKLIELYESAVSEGNNKVEDDHNNSSTDFTENGHENFNLGNCNLEAKDVDHWERQLQEMHEENDKLLSLYEKAMQERDEFKRILYVREQNNMEVREEIQCAEKLVEVDGGRVYWGENLELVEHPSKSGEVNSGSRNLYISEMDGTENMGSIYSEDEQRETEVEEPKTICEFETRHGELAEATLSKEELNFARTQLEMAQLKLEKAARAVSFFGLLEKATVDVDNLSKEIEASEKTVRAKQQEIGALKLLWSEKKARITIVDKKLLAIKSALSTFCSSVNYWEHQEAQARTRVDTSSHFLKRKKDELSCLQICKEEIEISHSKAQQSKIELRNHVGSIKSRLQDAEDQRKETEKVLSAIDNLDKTEVPTQRNLHFGKASELLKSEEERAVLLSDLKQSREKLAAVHKEIENLGRKRSALETEIGRVNAEIMTGLPSMEEAEKGLQNVVGEKESLLGMREEGRREVENMILEYQQCVYESYSKEEETKIYEEELCMEIRNLEDWREKRMQAIQKKRLLEDENYNFGSTLDLDKDLWCVSEKVEAELCDVQRSVLEARSLLAANET